MKQVSGANAALSAARAAIWTFRAEQELLSVRSAGSGFLGTLDGSWSLAALARDLRPGNAQRLREAFFPPVQTDLPIDIALEFRDGAGCRLIGAWAGHEIARGLLIATTVQRATLSTDHQVSPVFQPIRRIEDLSVCGFEALARITDPGGGTRGPERYLAGAGPDERAALARSMMSSAVETLSRLRKRRPDVFMNVNLGADDLADPCLVEELSEQIRIAGLPRGAIRIELTEQAAVQDFDQAAGALSAIRAAGAGIVLDDFAAGHSSFVWLSEINADDVKLDPALVRRLHHPRGARILAALSGLIRSLGMTVTAEGVEDPAAASRLGEAGCDYIQGFAFDFPLEERLLDALLSEGAGGIFGVPHRDAANEAG